MKIEDIHKVDTDDALLAIRNLRDSPLWTPAEKIKKLTDARRREHCTRSRTTVDQALQAAIVQEEKIALKDSEMTIELRARVKLPENFPSLLAAHLKKETVTHKEVRDYLCDFGLLAARELAATGYAKNPSKS